MMSYITFMGTMEVLFIGAAYNAINQQKQTKQRIIR